MRKRTIHRLGFITDAPHFGGAEQYIINVARAARREGIASSVCWLAPREQQQMLWTGCDVQTVAFAEQGWWPGLVRSVRQFLAANGPDAVIINASGRPRLWAVPWIVRCAGIPCIWVHHMVDSRDYRRLRPRWFNGQVEGPQLWRWPQALRHRLAAAGANRVVALNEADRDQISRQEGLSSRRITVIPNGIDTELFRFDARSRQAQRTEWFGAETDHLVVVGAAGRLVGSKGFDRLIRAVATLRAEGRSVAAVIAGEGPSLGALQSRSRELGIEAYVRFIGSVQDMPGFYSGLDVFALLSDTESFGLVLAEAMACERLVIATPTSGARVQIAHGENGLLLDSFDDRALISALREACDKNLQSRLGEQARRDVLARFDISDALHRTLKLFSGQDETREACRPSLVMEGRS